MVKLTGITPLFLLKIERALKILPPYSAFFLAGIVICSLHVVPFHLQDTCVSVVVQRSLLFIFSLYQRSKMNFVDLAGSERVQKLNADGQQLSEAKFFNLSLHHLESVIIALQKFNVRSLRSCSRKKQSAKFSKCSSSATLREKRSEDTIHKQQLNERLISASATELGRGRHAGVGTDYEPVHVPYRNSLLTMVLKDSLGE